MTPVDDWAAARSYFADHGHYWHVELGKKRYVVDPDRRGLQSTPRAVAERAGLTLLGEHGVAKTTTSDDVREVGRQWEGWAGGPQ